MPRSNSSQANLGLAAKARNAWGLLRNRLRMASGDEAAAMQIAEIEQHVETFRHVTGKDPAESTVLEIGFGARPRRAFLLSGYFKQVYAIDLDAPVLSLRDAFSTWQSNGIERAAKSVVRHALFDARDWPRFHAAARRRLAAYDPAQVRFVVGPAGDAGSWTEIPPVDFVFSADVFEHIPPAELDAMLALLRKRLAREGLVITLPMVFTGILGGHDPAWTRWTVAARPPSEAWRHLIDPNFAADTYLNKLSRKDFVEAFTRAGFSVERDAAVLGRLGAEHLTEAKLTALPITDEYELFSNRVEFHLR